MTKTKKTLIVSVISLMLCVAMMLGTTYAWFTDSVTSGTNKIVAGELDIDVLANGTSIKNQETLFQTKNWEPGVISYQNFTVQNKGTLAAKIKFNLDVLDENQMTEGEYKLSQIIKVAYLEDTTFSGDRTAAQALTYGDLTDQSSEFNLDANATKNIAVVLYWKPTDNDNNWNANNGKTTSDGKPLYINIAVNAVATQYTEEEDSFDNQYDKNAVYPVLAALVDIEESYSGNFVQNAKYSGGTADSTQVTAKEAIQLANNTGVTLISAGTTLYKANGTADEAITTKNESADGYAGSIVSNIKTTDSTTDSVTYQISYSYKEGETSTSVSKFSSVVTNIFDVSKGLKNVAVTTTHNGGGETNLTQLSSNTSTDKSFYYDSANGKLYVYSSEYSTFKFTYEYDFVAAVNGQGYATLTEAFAAAKENDTVTLLQSIDLKEAKQTKDSAIYIDKSMTLDLNQKTITVSAAQTADGTGEATAVVVTNASEAINVTIKNGTITTTKAANGIIARKNANLTLTGLTVDQNGLSNATAYRHAAVTATEGAVVTISNGTYSAAYYALYNKANGGKITVNGGTFTTDGQDAEITSYENGYPAAVRGDFATSEGNEITINGGTFGVAEGKKGAAGDFGGASDNKVTITAGTFNGVIESRYNAVAISGGTFNGTIYPTDGGHCGFYTLSGGQFVDDLVSVSHANATIADGYAAAYKDGMFYVGETWQNNHYEAVENGKDITITTAAQLAGFAKNLNEGKSYNNCTVTISGNIDLGQYIWVPMNYTCNDSMTFEGGNFTISNLTTAGNKGVGLFGDVVGVTIKNIKINTANVYGVAYAGVVVGKIYGHVSDCEVTNAVISVTGKSNGTVYEDGAKAGTIVGYLCEDYKDSIKNCKATTITINGYRDLGGIVGCCNESNFVTGNTISGVTINQGNYTIGYEDADYTTLGAIYGRVVAHAKTGERQENTGDATINTYPANN